MKKYSVVLVSAAMLVSSCTTGVGTGAYAGSSLGSILGSAIGGIAGGPRGSDIGTIVGMAGGAIVGGAMGNAADQHARQEQHDRLAERNQRIQRQKQMRQQGQQLYGDTYGYQQQDNNYQQQDNSYMQQDSTVDPSQMVDNDNSGDDRIDFTASTGGSDSLSIDASSIEGIYAKAENHGKLTVKNVRFADASGDGILSAGEEGKLTFEIYNNSAEPICNFYPTVAEADGNERIYISPSICVENINPGQGLRYTATVKADRRIKDGQIRLLVSTQKDGKPNSYVTVVKVSTQKR